MELEATEAAEVFKKAMELADPHWETIGRLKTQSLDAFGDWYMPSAFEKALSPYNKKLWDICTKAGKHGLMAYWLSYTRKYPERVAEQN